MTWATIEPILLPVDSSHRLGCHNQRVPDRCCFSGPVATRIELERHEFDSPVGNELTDN